MATAAVRINPLKPGIFSLAARSLKRNVGACNALDILIAPEVKEKSLARSYASEGGGKGSFVSKLLGRSVSPHTDAHSKVLTESLTLYELQFHYVKPECMSDYLELVSQMLPKFDNNEKFPAKLVGSWTTQYGELDQVVHLWSYKGGYKSVSDAKHFLATDQEFLDFAKTRSTLMRRRQNQLLHEFSFWGEPQLREPSHIYELRSYSLKAGTLIEWGNNWGLAIKIRQKDAVGGFFSQIGELYQVHHIWAYKDLSHRKKAREIMWQEPAWGDCVANTVPLVNHMESRILVPASYSPMQ
eukprot:Seg1721.10 transcript_id=Seg1721.10/GoldUCD/mRNA.D3Y31 product="Protein NipSnap 1" protein_id=Seg1721.10/GoldUCD/D3Y31